MHPNRGLILNNVFILILFSGNFVKSTMKTQNLGYRPKVNLFVY